METKRTLIPIIAVIMLAMPMVFIGTSDAVSPESIPFNGTEYMVTFDTNSAGQAMIEPASLTTVNQKISDMPVPVWKDHTFKGWYTGTDDKSERITEDHIYTANTTVYAHWQEEVDRYNSGLLDFTDTNTLVMIAFAVIVLIIGVFALVLGVGRRRR